MRIAIVEDHPAERELIATMCAEYFNGRNVGATAGRNAMQTVCDVFPDAKSFIESWKNSRYDLLLLDCYLSDENLPHATTGLDIARLLRNQNDDCAIVFITSSTDFAVLGYKMQASGYLLKGVSVPELTQAVRTVVSGGAMINPNIALKVVKLFSQLAQGNFSVPVEEGAAALLSRTER